MDNATSVGRIVHYVDHAAPAWGNSDKYTSVCRAAVIVQVGDGGAPGWVTLCVLDPAGVHFVCRPQDEDDKAPGTWHWPERV